MATISVRGLDSDQIEALKDLARRQGISLNRLVLERLQDGRGSEGRPHEDLDALAGTWSEWDAQDFAVAIAPLEQIDPDLWA